MMEITQGLAAAVALALSSAISGQTAKPAEQKTPPPAQQIVTGCLTTARAESTPPHAARTIYTLELSDSTAAGRSGGKEQAAKPSYVVSGDQAIALSKYVGQKVQLTGELLMPPSSPVGSTDPTERTKPLPGDAEGTFRVSSLKVISAKCKI
jgi:hypothetical protein